MFKNNILIADRNTGVTMAIDSREVPTPLSMVTSFLLYIYINVGGFYR